MSVPYHLACDRCRVLLPLDKLGDEAVAALSPPLTPWRASHRKKLEQCWVKGDPRLEAIAVFERRHRRHPLVLSTPDADHGLDYRVARPFDPERFDAEAGSADPATRRAALSSETVFDAEYALVDPALERAATEEADPDVRAAALGMLIRRSVQSPGARAALEVLRDEFVPLTRSGPVALRGVAVQALGVLKDPAAIATLVPLLKEDAMAPAAAGALRSLCLAAADANALAEQVGTVLHRLASAEPRSQMSFLDLLPYCGCAGRDELETLARGESFATRTQRAKQMLALHEELRGG